MCHCCLPGDQDVPASQSGCEQFPRGGEGGRGGSPEHCKCMKCSLRWRQSYALLCVNIYIHTCTFSSSAYMNSNVTMNFTCFVCLMFVPSAIKHCHFLKLRLFYVCVLKQHCQFHCCEVCGEKRDSGTVVMGFELPADVWNVAESVVNEWLLCKNGTCVIAVWSHTRWHVLAKINMTWYVSSSQILFACVVNISLCLFLTQMSFLSHVQTHFVPVQSGKI